MGGGGGRGKGILVAPVARTVLTSSCIPTAVYVSPSPVTDPPFFKNIREKIEKRENVRPLNTNKNNKKF